GKGQNLKERKGDAQSPAERDNAQARVRHPRPCHGRSMADSPGCQKREQDERQERLSDRWDCTGWKRSEREKGEKSPPLERIIPLRTHASGSRAPFQRLVHLSTTVLLAV